MENDFILSANPTLIVVQILSGGFNRPKGFSGQSHLPFAAIDPGPRFAQILSCPASLFRVTAGVREQACPVPSGIEIRLEEHVPPARPKPLPRLCCLPSFRMTPARSDKPVDPDGVPEHDCLSGSR